MYAVGLFIALGFIAGPKHEAKLDYPANQPDHAKVVFELESQIGMLDLGSFADSNDLNHKLRLSHRSEEISRKLLRHLSMVRSIRTDAWPDFYRTKHVPFLRNIEAEIMSVIPKEKHSQYEHHRFLIAMKQKAWNEPISFNSPWLIETLKIRPDQQFRLERSISPFAKKLEKLTREENQHQS